MATALITGANSGIGSAFARKLASDGYDLVLTARNVERLEAEAEYLRSHYPGTVDVMVADLATDEGMRAVEDRITDANDPIDFLVNNAGFGIKGDFYSSDRDAHEAVLRVNALAVLRLTHAAMSQMVPRDNGDILNVASVAAFTPGVRPSSTYAASKAFVASLTEGLAPAVLGTNVHMSVVCPGWVKSNFHDAAGIGMSKLPGFMWLTPEFVAEQALKDHRLGKVITVPGTVYKAIMFLARAVPRPLVVVAARLSGKLSH